MKRLWLIPWLMGAMMLVLAAPAMAVTISMYSPGGISAWSYDINNYDITIYEIWSGNGAAFLELDGLEQFEDYTVTKYLWNETGTPWDRFALEVLDPSGDTNDSLYDAVPQPSFIPAGFSSSNENDGLSFAQGTVPRSSDVFTMVYADELSTRDFVDFYGGFLADFGFGYLQFGLRDNGSNQPFLLAQRPNVSSVPEPSGLLLLGTGIVGLLAFRRKVRV